jgi:hypothetical protein
VKHDFGLRFRFDPLYLLYLSSFCFAISLLISRRARRYRKERQLLSSTFHLFTNAVFLSSIWVWGVHLRDESVLYDLEERKRARKKDKRENKSQRYVQRYSIWNLRGRAKVDDEMDSRDQAGIYFYIGWHVWAF